MNLPGHLLQHQVLVRPYAGESSHGPAYGTEIAVRANVQDKRQLVADSTGAEVLSETAVFLPPGTTCPAESLVTAKGRTGRAVVVSDAESGGLPTPDHVEIALI